MKPLRAIFVLGVLSAAAFARDPVSAADIADSLSQITLDQSQTYRVRDLHLRRGDVSFYLTDGLLSFAAPINGKRVAAVFTTTGSETGDAEVLLLPPEPAERASLASFAKSPNLDEHFSSAILYFSDATADELLTQIAKEDGSKAPELDLHTRSSAERILRNASAEVKTRMVSAILDPGEPEHSFFTPAFLAVISAASMFSTSHPRANRS